MLLLIFGASVAGVLIASIFPWSVSARSDYIHRAVGLGLAPFVLGICGVMVLACLPGAESIWHLGTVFIVLGMVSVLFWLIRKGKCEPIVSRVSTPRSFGEYIFSGLVLLWAVFLLINTIFLPLSQNDALEYATVARELFFTRDLANYPVINSQESVSGFFGPWTHPPLYVALAYLAQLAQGHSNDPGFMRLISPWFGLCATYLVYILGKVVSRLTGLVSATIFLSTPLFFAGADSALIDALPILGILIVVACVFAFDVSPVRRGACIGFVLGLSLWTHSQAILFIPITVGLVVLRYGSKGLANSFKELFFVLLMAFVIGGWPYWRNWLLFGSPISDNPAVFALPLLDWPAYFSVARGLDKPAAIFQYGVLKGWFSLEAYGWAFWLMLFGVFLLVRSLRQALFPNLLCNGAQGVLQPPQHLLFLSLLVVVVYLSGVVTSVALGLDLMIKNERYMLVILPFVALLAGSGVTQLLFRGAMIVKDEDQPPFRRDLLVIGAFFLALILLSQLWMLGWYYRWRHDVPRVVLSKFDSQEEAEAKKKIIEQPIFERRLAQNSALSAVFWMRNNLPQDALVLSLRPADMYYSQRKMLSFLDERLLSVYQEASADRAASLLRELGVSYIHVPDYGVPATYNSVLDSVIENPRLTRLVHSNGGTRIFELLFVEDERPVASVFSSRRFSPSDEPWTVYRQLNIGGRKAMSILGLGGDSLPTDGRSSPPFSLPVFHRDFSTVLANGRGSPMSDGRLDSLLKIQAGQEYRVRFDLQGRGLVRLWVMQLDAQGKILADSPISSGVERFAEQVLDSPDHVQEMMKRFVALPQSAYIRFGLEHVGHSTLRIHDAILEQLLTESPEVIVSKQ